MKLRTRWLNALVQLGLDTDQGAVVFERILKYYAQRHRQYHNLSHIEALLDLAEQYRGELLEPAVVEMAIWFHDLVYRPLSKQNEKKSAQLARKWLAELGADSVLQERVAVLIRQTEKPTDFLPSKDRDMAWLLDFDLSILGRSTEVYARYAEAMRKEFKLVPEVLYRQGRVRLLRQFLKLDFIYRTGPMRRALERPARENLLKELKFWEHLG